MRRRTGLTGCRVGRGGEGYAMVVDPVMGCVLLGLNVRLTESSLHLFIVEL